MAFITIYSQNLESDNMVITEHEKRKKKKTKNFACRHWCFVLKSAMRLTSSYTSSAVGAHIMWTEDCLRLHLLHRQVLYGNKSQSAFKWYAQVQWRKKFMLHRGQKTYNQGKKHFWKTENTVHFDFLNIYIFIFKAIKSKHSYKHTHSSLCIYTYIRELY